MGAWDEAGIKGSLREMALGKGPFSVKNTRPDLQFQSRANRSNAGDGLKFMTGYNSHLNSISDE